MFEFAKRLMFVSLDKKVASASSAFAASSARSIISKDWFSDRILCVLCASVVRSFHHRDTEHTEKSGHLHISKSRHRRTVRDAHRLHRIALAAIRQAPDLPARAIADGITRAPEFWSRSAVDRISQQAAEAAVLDFPGNFAAELKIQADVIDRPRFVRVDEDSALRVSDHLGDRCRSRLE